MQRLAELLKEEWDEEESDIHIQEAHFYGSEIPTLNLRKETPTRPDNEKPSNQPPATPIPSSKPTLSPRAKKLSLLITIIITGIAGAIKVISEW